MDENGISTARGTSGRGLDFLSAATLTFQSGIQRAFELVLASVISTQISFPPSFLVSCLSVQLRSLRGECRGDVFFLRVNGDQERFVGDRGENVDAFPFLRE